ncbi:leukocyte elastase inhibitor-like [Topomyia yanbarensis]|uniref:leukocyte elastase inhibitor-like n=1 Tax=Topomyia yanbarensis TaxID=2498891 RepID=UPI00273C190B|nr:leukocyte elastase inhibitor-like [Topomyia yanbarensis]
MLIKAVVPLLFALATITAGADGPDFSYGDAHFSTDYFRAVYNASNNCVVSPLSVRLAMAAFYEVSGVATEETVQRAFYLPVLKSLAIENAASLLEEIGTSQQLKVAFKVLKKQNSLSDEFTETLGKVFKISPKNFEERSSVLHSVNSLASLVSSGPHRNLLREDDLNSNAEMILLNAVALRVSWAERFPIGETKRQVFAFRDGPREVDMMHETVEVLYKSDTNYHAIQIPFSEESDLTMWIFVPRGSGNFFSLMKSLSATLLEDMETTAVPETVDVSLPRFEIRSNHGTRTVIDKLGYGQLFKDIDFSTFKGRKSGLSELVQSAALKVDEKGTHSPGAATPAVAQNRAENTKFVADQPFVFIVKKISTDTIILIGHYSNYN